MRSRTTQSVFLALTLFALAAPAAYAQTDIGLSYASGIGLSTVDIRTIVADLIRSCLGMLGIYFVIRIMWGGFLMMTHGGNEDRRAEATGHLKGSILGFILIMMSSSIAKFVIDAVVNATTNNF